MCQSYQERCHGTLWVVVCVYVSVCMCLWWAKYTTGESKQTHIHTRPPCLQNRQESVVWSSSAVCDMQRLLETPDPNKDMGPTRWCPWCQRPEDEALSRNWCLEKPPRGQTSGTCSYWCDVLRCDCGCCLHSETGISQHLYHRNVSSQLNEKETTMKQEMKNNLSDY